MDDSGVILCQISSLKDMLDQVNEEIEANIQVTREIESEIVKCTEYEYTLAARESELTKTIYVSQFEIIGLVSVTNESRKSAKLLEAELSSLRKKREETLKRMNNKREQFAMQCLEFQREIDKGENDELMKLLSEKEFFENEIRLLDQKNDVLKNSMLAFVEEVLQDLQDSNSALHVEIQNMNLENEKLLRDIDELKTMLLSNFNYHHS
ncbi:hypothetical protein P3X46_017147 [Hevea brasiliensis]|uniref:Uncharacterized protein n=1 Tax=Hevea brasiliensis TaxID=3981 RepID=A0ABQ9M1G4_HEVBR|nr:uncharacterized protein LOC110664726 isoform X2 [Hevea brasiliensis]XP_021680247.2 uncharacterized protein LOC110664726 isoform X2 [Hevea brasiliensis]KAJ9174077.1 hypothetical protein P3X46_017147 [Hevea brasiliensis]